MDRRVTIGYVPDAPIDPGTPTDWPDATNTGYKGTLAPLGATTVSTPGTVIENKKISGRLTIDADNVTIRNCWVDSTDFYAILVYGKGCLIEDVTITGHANNQACIDASQGATGEFVARRVNASGAPDGIRLANNCGLYDSYVHDLGGDASAHNDAVTADQYTGWTVQHNTILNDRDQTACIWVADSRLAPSSGAFNNNLLAGGGYSIYAGPGTGTGIKITNNHFSTQYYPNCGYYGPVVGWTTEGGNLWSGNVWHDGPNAGLFVSPT